MPSGTELDGAIAALHANAADVLSDSLDLLRAHE